MDPLDVVAPLHVPRDPQLQLLYQPLADDIARRARVHQRTHGRPASSAALDLHGHAHGARQYVDEVRRQPRPDVGAVEHLSAARRGTLDREAGVLRQFVRDEVGEARATRAVLVLAGRRDGARREGDVGAVEAAAPAVVRFVAGAIPERRRV